MEALNQAGKTPCYLPTKKLRDLEVNKLYAITEVKKISTRYGIKIVLQLDSNFDIFLPSRVNGILVENEEIYNNFLNDTKKRVVKLKYLGNCLIEFI